MLKEERDIAIALVPEENSLRNIETIFLQIMKSYSINSFYNNIPHISLFQMRVLNEDIKEIKEILSKKFLNKYLIKPTEELINIDKNLFWIIEKDKLIERLSRDIQIKTKKFITKNLLPQINYKQLDLEKQKLIDEYGIYWGISGVNFLPHITVIYNFDRKINNNIKIPVFKKGIKSKLKILEIGFYGNAKEEI